MASESAAVWVKHSNGGACYLFMSDRKGSNAYGHFPRIFRIKCGWCAGGFFARGGDNVLCVKFGYVHQKTLISFFIHIHARPFCQFWITFAPGAMVTVPQVPSSPAPMELGEYLPFVAVTCVTVSAIVILPQVASYPLPIPAAV